MHGELVEFHTNMSLVQMLLMWAAVLGAAAAHHSRRRAIGRHACPVKPKKQTSASRARNACWQGGAAVTAKQSHEWPAWPQKKCHDAMQLTRWK